MTHPCTFDDLLGLLHRRSAQLPDHRTGKNTQYRISDAALGAFGILFTPSPSFLDYQRTRQHAKGDNNAHTLLGVQHIPGDNQVRKLLDPIPPSHLDPVFVEVFEALEQQQLVAPFRSLGDQRLGALDGTNSFSSNPIQCPNCLTRQRANGPPLYYHAAITPVIVCPGQSQVIALPPESIRPQDGQSKQDCARAAGKRWLAKHAARVAPHGVTVLGDALYRHQPLCVLALQHGYNFIFVCTPDSPVKCYERLAFWQAHDGLVQVERRHWHGRYPAVLSYRYSNAVLLREGEHALRVQGFEIPVVHAKTGEQLYHNSCITNHPVTATTGAEVAHAGRGRWKIENENNNVLKTKGYHVAHNFGHGKQYLAAFLLSLNLLAFLFHTVLEWSDDR